MDNMTNINKTFDGSVPDLVNSKILNDINAELNIQPIDENKIINGMGYVYTEFISPNLFPIIVVCLLFLYLAIKYTIKNCNNDNKAKHDKHRITDTQHIITHNHDIPKVGNKQNNVVNEPKIKKTILKDAVGGDLSDYISDDYLITETEQIE